MLKRTPTCRGDGERVHGVRPRSRLLTAPGPRPAAPVWARLPEINTWRAFEENISQAGIMEFVEQWEAHGFRFGCVTIDEGWTRRDAAFGDWIPDERRFPDLRGLVDWLHARGYRTRLWVAPLCVNEGSQIAQSSLRRHFLTGKSGQPIRQVGRHAYLLDARAAGVQRYAAETFERLVRAYDVDGFKLDFCFTESDCGQPSGYANDNFEKPARQKIHRALFHAARQGCDAARPGVRIESYPLEHCAEYIDDVISGDLIGTERSQASHESLNARLLSLARKHDWIAWPEMVWGLGSESPVGNPDWERTYLEWIATDINYERKIELSFPPWSYANAHQIRALVNLCASGGAQYKVVQAGHVTFDLEKLQRDGIDLTNQTRFLAAPHADTEIRLVVPPSCGRPEPWEVVNLLHPERIHWTTRDENWEDGKRWHCVRFAGRAGEVYEFRTADWICEKLSA